MGEIYRNLASGNFADDTGCRKAERFELYNIMVFANDE